MVIQIAIYFCQLKSQDNTELASLKKYQTTWRYFRLANFDHYYQSFLIA